jgi:hypothetical protein
LTLVILVLAFGTLIAAGLPFLMGLAATMVALGLAFLLARAMPVSNLLGNVVTMIGLAVGIDYSLLMVKDYRERLRTAAPVDAVAATVGEAGATICLVGLHGGHRPAGPAVQPRPRYAQRRHRRRAGGGGVRARRADTAARESGAARPPYRPLADHSGDAARRRHGRRVALARGVDRAPAAAEPRTLRRRGHRAGTAGIRRPQRIHE